MKKASLMLLLSGAAMTTQAGVHCELRDFEVEVYDQAGAYLHGKLEGQAASWIVICGKSATEVDYTSRATDRRISLAVAAQLAGKSLSIYFQDFDSCSQYTNYTVVNGLKLKRH